MKQDYTEIVVLLDRSGSMQDGKDDHEGGLLSFVEDQQQLPGDVRFTLIQFDNVEPCEIVYDGVPIGEVQRFKLIPRGGTPLLDAVGMSIAHVAQRLQKSEPDQVVVMIITDGQENSSQEYTREQIKQMISEYESKHRWKFLYLGADVDAFAEAGGLAIGAGAALMMKKSPEAIKAAYRAMSANTAESRQLLQEEAPMADVFAAHEFKEEQRRQASE